MTVAIIQARLSSRRFPRKALADLEGHPLIWWVCTRVREVAGLGRVVLVCPESDAEAFTAVVPPGVEVLPSQTTPVRWHPDGSVAAWDVLAAFARATEHLEPSDWVLRVTGDCPCWNPEVGRGLLLFAAMHSQEDELWASADTTCSGWADGEDAELIPVYLLRHIAERAFWPLDREHVTRYLRRHYPYYVLDAPEDRGHLKLSIDRIEDLTAVREYLRTRETR